MAEGGFLLKFNGEDVAHCYSINMDYDDWKYQINNDETNQLPKDLRSIVIEVEGNRVDAA